MVTPVSFTVCTWFDQVVCSDPLAVPPTYSLDDQVPDVDDLVQVQYTSYVPDVEQVSELTDASVVDVVLDVLWLVCTFIEPPPPP